MSVTISNEAIFRLTLVVAAVVVLLATDLFGVLGTLLAIVFVVGVFYFDRVKISS